MSAESTGIAGRIVGPVSGEFLDWSTLSAWDVTFALLSVVAGWILSRLVRREIEGYAQRARELALTAAAKQ